FGQRVKLGTLDLNPDLKSDGAMLPNYCHYTVNRSYRNETKFMNLRNCARFSTLSASCLPYPRQ
ncbi:hypothetical protein L9F63_022749, partial [Diploptera punctata]